MLAMLEDLRHEKKQAVKVAKELCYGDEVANKIKNAKTPYEIDRILHAARNAQNKHLL